MFVLRRAALAGARLSTVAPRSAVRLQPVKKLGVAVGVAVGSGVGLGEVALAFCGAASPADQKRMDGLLEADAEAGFARGWLELKQLGWAADLLAGQPDATLPQIAAE